MQQVLLLHGKNGFANMPQHYVYTYIASLVGNHEDRFGSYYLLCQ
jgi:hypothetical protein